MKEGKPFFFRIDLIELMDFATEPEGENMTLLQFSKELKKGQSDHPTIQKIINEAHNYIEKKRNAGSKGGQTRVNNAQAVLDSTKAKSCSAQARSSTEAVTITEEELKDISASADAASADDEWISKKKRKLEGKRLGTFKEFWEAFDYKRARAEAIDAWLDIPQLTTSLVLRIVEAAKVEARGRPELIRLGSTPKMAQGWISGRRWEDSQSDNSSSSWADDLEG